MGGTTVQASILETILEGHSAGAMGVTGRPPSQALSLSEAKGRPLSGPGQGRSPPSLSPQAQVCSAWEPLGGRWAMESRWGSPLHLVTLARQWQ